ncbi:protein split ends-like [Paramacrobiotus metropolitanus]|uniref:protein split ends-like n=1 Tax=Paramacrobiotus metropolitanus TaxID=2943436 RepID=UPI002445F476|nr:protein split ends-like [Paramacrobiotus metropolitanus]
MSGQDLIEPAGPSSGIIPSVFILSAAADLPAQGSLLSAGKPADTEANKTTSNFQAAIRSTVAKQYPVNNAYRKPKGKKRPNADDDQSKDKPSRRPQPPNEDTLKKLRNVVEVNPYSHSVKDSHDAWCEVVLLSRERIKNDAGELVADASPVLFKEIQSLKALVRRNSTKFNERHVRITGTEEEWEEWDKLMEQIKEYSECVPLSTRDPEKAAREAGLQARIRATQLGMKSGTTKVLWDGADEDQAREDLEFDMGLTDHPDELAGNLRFDDDELADFKEDGTVAVVTASRTNGVPHSGARGETPVAEDGVAPITEKQTAATRDTRLPGGRSSVSEPASPASEDEASTARNDVTKKVANNTLVAKKLSKPDEAAAARKIHRKQITEKLRQERIVTSRQQIVQTFTSLNKTVARMEHGDSEERRFEREERIKDREAERESRQEDRALQWKLAQQEAEIKERDRQERIMKEEEDRTERKESRDQQFQLQKLEIEGRNKQQERMLDMMEKFVTKN